MCLASLSASTPFDASKHLPNPLASKYCLRDVRMGAKSSTIKRLGIPSPFHYGSRNIDLIPVQSALSRTLVLSGDKPLYFCDVLGVGSRDPRSFGCKRRSHWATWCKSQIPISLNV